MSHTIYTVMLDLEDPPVFNASAIGGHKTFDSHAPYLLFVHIGKVLLNHFLLLLARVFVGIIPSFVEDFGFFRYRLGVIGHHG